MRHLPLMLLLAAGTTGCADSVINEIAPGNQETVTVVGDSFAYIATNLENVSDRVSFTWNNPMERLTLIHQSFLPHGYGLLVIRDAGGQVVDSTLLEYQLETESRAGVPGLWTVNITYAAAWGRAQFTLVPLTGDPLAGTREASASAVRLHPVEGLGRGPLEAWAKEADEKRRGR